MIVYHKTKLEGENDGKSSEKQSLAKKPNLVQNQESATGGPLVPERIYQNYQSLVLIVEDHSNF